MNNAPNQRKYDIIVWGASGFTGRLVTEYLLGKYGAHGNLRWAIAGRDRSKLQEICSDLPVIIADSFDKQAMHRLAADTSVVLTTVGPYARYGSALVEACVANGTHYCDLAGEVQWMRRMIDRFQQDAEKSGARIVHSCGFDSIPSDIGVWLLQQQATERHGGPCAEIKLLVKAMKGGASGGTFASMMNAVEESRRDRDVARILRDPYALNPEGERSGPDGPDQAGAEFDDDTGAWTAPFIMASVNTRVVRRTNALLDYAYGRDFRYSEATLTGKGPGGWMKSASMTAGLGGFILASAFGPSRAVLETMILPRPGDGPGRQRRESGFFNLHLVGKLPDSAVVRARVTGDRDPGYGSTSRMLGESAVCLATDKLPLQGGFWTPASAMGNLLSKRLVENAGLTFKIE
ncbi:MAG: saccharopine dehydrogenase family protein [Woeseia sp.]